MNLDEIRRIAVIGAGILGHSMAQEFALAGYGVALAARKAWRGPAKPSKAT